MTHDPGKGMKRPDHRFDFAGTPGPMCPMRNALKHVVRCATWPESLLDMYRAGMLKGDAYEYAAQLAKDLEQGSMIDASERLQETDPKKCDIIHR